MDLLVSYNTDVHIPVTLISYDMTNSKRLIVMFDCSDDLKKSWNYKDEYFLFKVTDDEGESTFLVGHVLEDIDGLTAEIEVN